MKRLEDELVGIRKQVALAKLEELEKAAAEEKLELSSPYIYRPGSAQGAEGAEAAPLSSPMVIADDDRAAETDPLEISTSTVEVVGIETIAAKGGFGSCWDNALDANPYMVEEVSDDD
mmetsp:Transcript_40285/g.126028  ORF Transcript_40285/g.126028 Transcript_40285/m.126028 type:complete len:118 (+) Transcript_40285:236-589(+)